MNEKMRRNPLEMERLKVCVDFWGLGCDAGFAGKEKGSAAAGNLDNTLVDLRSSLFAVLTQSS